MFKSGDVVKVLLPNIVNEGYDYRLIDNAGLGSFVECTVMNRKYIGVVYGVGDSGLPPEKIKNVSIVFPYSLPITCLQWLKRMADWTLMSPGAVLRLIVNVPDAFLPPRTEQLYLFNFDEKLGRMTEARQMVCDAYLSNDNEPMAVSDIQNITHIGMSVIKNMIAKNFLIPATQRVIEHDFNYFYHDTNSIRLNEEQQYAADKIADRINNGGYDVFLLDGITGSGKTQVYFDAAWHAYQRGKSVLLLMPEISLTAQFMNRFESRFGAKPVVWHSNLTSAQRRDIWRGVLRNEIKFIVGTRSALFLPWQNLGLIVVDEEHDSSYKQEEMGNYHARDMAVLRASIEKIPIVLASATPCAETFYNVENGKYTRLKLSSRFGGATMPSIETIDMRINHPDDYLIEKDEEKETVSGNLSPILCQSIKDVLDKHQQVMLFINRRGFASIVQCKKCGYVATCPDCSTGMTYHKKLEKLVCHMCGRVKLLSDTCPECGGRVSMRGAGLEKIEQEVIAKFPTANVALVSSDTMMSRQALERLVAKMESGEINIVIGTQILAKGHHFPNLTLVGVVDADMGLFGTDFRAGEHTFQQLFQVAGRAGRGELPGTVFLQTFQPDNPVLNAICSGDRDGFMKMDMGGRRSANMPPFGQLIAIIIEGQKESVLKSYCDELRASAPLLRDGKIMGPIMAQVYQIRGWYRMRFLVSGRLGANLQGVVKNWLKTVKQPVNVRVKIDVGPQSFM